MYVKFLVTKFKHGFEMFLLIFSYQMYVYETKGITNLTVPISGIYL